MPANRIYSQFACVGKTLWHFVVLWGEKTITWRSEGVLRDSLLMAFRRQQDIVNAFALLISDVAAAQVKRIKFQQTLKMQAKYYIYLCTYLPTALDWKASCLRPLLLLGVQVAKPGVVKWQLHQPTTAAFHTLKCGLLFRTNSVDPCSHPKQGSMASCI